MENIQADYQRVTKAWADYQAGQENNSRAARYTSQVQARKVQYEEIGGQSTIPMPVVPRAVAWRFTGEQLQWELYTTDLAVREALPDPIPPVVPPSGKAVSKVGPAIPGTVNFYSAMPGDNAPDGFTVVVDGATFTKRLFPGPFGNYSWYERKV